MKTSYLQGDFAAGQRLIPLTVRGLHKWLRVGTFASRYR